MKLIIRIVGVVLLLFGFCGFAGILDWTSREYWGLFVSSTFVGLILLAIPMLIPSIFVGIIKGIYFVGLALYDYAKAFIEAIIDFARKGYKAQKVTISDYMRFKVMILPIFIRFFHLIVFVVALIASLAGFVGTITLLIFGKFLFIKYVALMVLWAWVTYVLVRVILEGSMIFYAIHERLNEALDIFKNGGKKD